MLPESDNQKRDVVHLEALPPLAHSTETLMPSSLPLTRASGMAPLLVFLESLGAPTAQLLQQARIPPALMEEREALVPLHLVHRFAEVASGWSGIDNIGVMVGQDTCAYDLGAFGELLKRAVTAYDYLQTGARLIGAVTSGERFWMTREGNQVRFHHFQPGHPGAGRCQSDLYALVVTIGMLRSFFGPGWKPREVRLLATDAGLVGDGAVFGDTRVHLNQSHSSFTMAFASLGQAIPGELRKRSGQLGGVTDIEPLLPSGFLDSVESLIGSLLLARRLDINVVAEAAGTSTRSLQRRLQGFGLSYSAIVEQTRTRMATDWLSETGMPISEIAALLGYSDPAHFSRAFGRKSGISPQQYRRQYR